MSTPASIAKHPLHPMFVAFPIGLFVFSFAMDLIYFFGSHDPMWNLLAFYTMEGGIAGGLLAAVFGFIDFLALAGRAQKLAIYHMSLNLTIVVLFAINAIMRSMGVPVVPVPLILSLAAIILLLVSGWLGGEMVFVEGVAVEPRRPESKPYRSDYKAAT